MVFISGFLSLSLWLLASSLPLLALFASFFGFSSGVFVALLPPIIGQISPNDRLGARIGAFYSVVAVASLIGAPIGSALIKRNDSGVVDSRNAYKGLIVYAVSMNVISYRPINLANML
jgi:MCP family monocarboxylic acid transporter-like MFS transporter 10